MHARILVSTGFKPLNLFSKLVSLYARFNDLGSAVSVFSAIQEPNTMLWNLIVRTHIDSGRVDSALLLYRKMRELGVSHDCFTFPIVNKAVLLVGSDVRYAGMVHSVAIQMGFGLDVYFGNTMIEVYVKCGNLSYARKLFDEMPDTDLVSWTSMISGYVSEGNVASGFSLFSEMRMELEPNSVTILVMLQACCGFETSIYGRQVHGYVIKNGLLSNGAVQNSILRMYAKLGTIEEVEDFFRELDRRDVVSWNICISSYTSKGDFVKVRDLFNEMQGGVAPSIETLTIVLSALTKHGILSQGESLHGLAIKSGLHDDVLQTSLLDFYAKCGKLESSDKLFRELPDRNCITCGAMMLGLIHNGYFNEAVGVFRQMQAAGLDPGAEILRNLIDAFANLGALKLGKAVHGYIVRKSFCGTEEAHTHLETSILNMYIRCGSISTSRVCFNRMVFKDVVAWTSMIEGYGSHGLGFEASKLFDLMTREGIKPNSVTFLSLLSAYSHSGLVTEGCEAFYYMKWRFGIEPDIDHYTCVVDLLGRSGKLKEALAVILKMLAFPDSRIWGALLSGSRIYGNRALGQYAAQRLLELEPGNVGYFTLLSNTEASVGHWDEVEEIRKVMKENDLKKKPGWSCIEANGVIHGFVSGGNLHHHIEEIYEVLGWLSRMMQGFI
ncbi:pentatricopeptide repeat-containing protein DOT4, chloroplastic-like [Rosa rugosa]|uniref:pentatricopeptide repeat-containing protein DOT4, chloroplastic-like n=1 Tax=Rosa rugosa TaxID=74645 RepID=UPI002B404E27|nr:pentatricopeptide repeat-containing protein DOT4, chloroplastic-like [Rosa rugosa]XP_062007501.1 pentatricopeptide repeat-containing protein DOT4, chloroplastic-like [Rosa rugosa]